MDKLLVGQLRLLLGPLPLGHLADELSLGQRIAMPGIVERRRDRSQEGAAQDAYAEN